MNLNVKYFFCGLILIFGRQRSFAAEVKIAVASNFSDTLETLRKAYERTCNDKLVITSGSTGQLFAQIKNGAPFDIFLAADQAHPKLLVEEQLAVPTSMFTYAIGRLVLIGQNHFNDPKEILVSPIIKHVAIANPGTAPYGAAATYIIEKLGVEKRLEKKIVTGASVSQAFQFVQTKNAELGFVALSQVIAQQVDESFYWVVPQELYKPIRQDAALLTRARGNAAAMSFLLFLKSHAARQIILSQGYAE